MATIHLEYLGDLRCDCTHIQSDTHINTDAPTDNQGRGEAFSPTDLVANALGTCILTTMAIFARRDGIDLKGSEMDVTKVMSSEPPRKIVKIVIDLTLRAEQDGVAVMPDESTRVRLEKIAHTCPVAVSLHTDLVQDVTIRWTVAETV
jgi:putative redox protein